MYYIWLCFFSLLIQESHLEKRPLSESSWALCFIDFVLLKDILKISVTHSL